ncbi:uncharacterized protein LOC133311243 [Gastrolobium bilobum]|uniref:uncharacterized protein LOC133311243 n=1 Tax=Gastrolobium bilobum TaxID=150636 RepID=UPI002AB2CE72|nr:uncharacterized protein LOC133311243 [Gastrolobium bilobum]
MVRKNMEFLKRGFDNGVVWANEALCFPLVAKKINDFFWLHDLEDPLAPPFSASSWPHPWYPELQSFRGHPISVTFRVERLEGNLPLPKSSDSDLCTFSRK